MNTAPIAAVTNNIGGLPFPPQPSVPAVPSFSDMLTSATSSLAAFALLPAAGSDALASFDIPAPPVPKKDPGNVIAAAAIALPVPVQAPLAAALNGSGAEAGASPSQQTSGASGQQPTQSAPQATASANGSAGTGGTSNGSAQTAGGVALPPVAAQLNARLALGAQALLSQPSQTLATLPHGALQAAATPTLAPNLAAAAHNAAAPDPSSALPKLASSATLAAATPNGTAPSLETALQSAAPAPANPIPTAAADSIECAALGNAGDTTAQAADPGLGTAPAPASLPLPGADAAPAMESAAAPMVAASALDQVAASLTQGNKLGLSQIEIQLRPASLGAVDVKIELSHDGRVTAVISADRSDTLMQLQRGSGELQQALKDAGLQTDSGSLSFNLRGDAQTSDQSSRQPSYAPATPSGDDLPSAPAAAAGASQSVHSGLLNIQV